MQNLKEQIENQDELKERTHNTMDSQIIRVNQNTWQIEDHGVRFFLLTGTEKALLIDSGMQVHNARDIAKTLTTLPIFLLNTHADMDHIGSNEQFDSFYMHPAEESCYRKAGRNGQLIPVVDGEELDLGNRRLRIIHLPGHTPGSIAILDTQNRVLISGDPIQEHGRIFMFGEHRNMQAYIDSLEKLNGLTDTFDELWPSHADIPIRPDVIPKLIDGARKILNKEIKGVTEEFHGRQIAAYDLGFTVILCDA